MFSGSVCAMWLGTTADTLIAELEYENAGHAILKEVRRVEPYREAWTLLAASA